MWRFRAMVITGVLFGMLLFSAISAHGFWWWNSKMDVQGVKLATVWEVMGDGDENQYSANIGVVVPSKASAVITEQADNEKVRIRHTGRLKCRENGIETVVSVRVKSGLDDDDSEVRMILRANGRPVWEATGSVGAMIVAKGLLPTHGRAC